MGVGIPIRNIPQSVLDEVVLGLQHFLVPLFFLRPQNSEPQVRFIGSGTLVEIQGTHHITGRLWRSQVEWFAHAPLAIKARLAPEIVADLKANRRPANMKPDEAAVYDFVMELSTKHQVSDETFDQAKQLLGEQQVVDLTAVTGTYVTIAMLLAMAEEGVPPGKEPPFKVGEP